LSEKIASSTKSDLPVNGWIRPIVPEFDPRNSVFRTITSLVLYESSRVYSRHPPHLSIRQLIESYSSCSSW